MFLRSLVMIVMAISYGSFLIIPQASGLSLDAQVTKQLECDMCTRVTQIVEGTLMKNATATETFQRVAQALCIHLPENVIPICRQGAHLLTTPVFKCMVQAVEFGSICNDSSIKLCFAERPSTQDPSLKCSSMQPSVLSCAACEFAISSLQQYVASATDIIAKGARTDVLFKIELVFFFEPKFVPNKKFESKIFFHNTYLWLSL